MKLVDKPPATTSSDDPSPTKQVKIDERPTGGLALSNTELKELVAGYIVEDMLPIPTVDSTVCQPCHLEPESENEEEEEDEEPTFTDVTEVLSTASGDGQFSLPPHYRCASHTINLISTSDVDKHLNSCADTMAVCRSSFAKCSALWTRASRSTLATEQVEEVSHRKLTVPTSTR